MSRSGKLVIGLLLLIISSVIFLASVNSQKTQSTTLCALIGIFGIPGLLIFISGIRPGLRSEEKSYVKMTFVHSRLSAGVSVTVVSIGILYLFYQVIHVMPQLVLIGAFLGVPGGLFLAGQSWVMACRKCGTPLEENGGQHCFSYCPDCRELVVLANSNAKHRLVIGTEATSLINNTPKKEA